MTSFSSPPPFFPPFFPSQPPSPVLSHSAPHSSGSSHILPGFPRYFSRRLHLPRLITLSSALPPPLFIIPTTSLFLQRCLKRTPPPHLPPARSLFPWMLASSPTCLSFHPTHLLLRLITLPLPFPFIHSLTLRGVVTLPACLSVCSIKGCLRPLPG